MNHPSSRVESVTIIEPQSGWQALNFKELHDYKDLFFFLVWRNIKVLYAQTVLGLSWAILEPLIQIVLFTIIFGKVAKIATDGIPYFLFSTVAIVPWSYMSQAMTQSSDSLVAAQGLLSKIYFPRLIFPLAPSFSKLVEFLISMVIVLLRVDLLSRHANLEFNAFPDAYALYDGDRHRFRAVDVGDGDSIPGCATGHAVFHPNIHVLSPGCLSILFDP